MAPETAAVPRTLLTGPAGTGKTHAALERLKEAATRAGDRGRLAGRPGDVLLVLPTYTQAMHLARVALARWDARAVLDDPFATFTSAGERYLEGYRVRVLPGAVERDQLMARALAEARVALFDAVADRPSFRARLLRFVKEAKQSGDDPALVRARLARGAAVLPPDARARLEGALSVFGHYDTLLARAGMEDHEDTLRRLAEQLVRRPPAHPPRLLAVDGFDDFTPVEMRILDALGDVVVERGGEVLVTLPWDERRPGLFAASAAPRDHLRRRGFVERRLPTPRRAPSAGLARIAADLFGSSPAPPEEGDDVLLIVAGDPEDEAEAVARLARAFADEEGCLGGWRDLGVIVRRLDEAGGRLLAAFERVGVPARLIGAGQPLAAEALVRALLGPLRLLAGRAFEPAGLLPWLRWSAGDEPDGRALAAVDALEMRWRRHGWPRDAAAWARDAERAFPGGGAPQALVASLAGLSGWDALEDALARAIVALAPLPSPGGLDADGRPEDPSAAARHERAAAARERVLALLAELAVAARRTGLGADVDASAAAGRLLDAIGETPFAPLDRRLDVVNLLDFEEARFWEIPVVVVVGLAEGEVPLRAGEDVFLGDDDRRALEAGTGVTLPLARDLQQRERRLFYGALTRATRRLVLVRSGFDAAGGVRAPSPSLRALESVVRPRLLGPPRGVGRAAPDEAECHTLSDWRLFAARALRHGDARARRRARAILAREGGDLERRASRWRIAGGDDLDLARHAARVDAAFAVVSAGALGHGLACRHRLFLARVANVPEDDAPLAGPALDGRARGTLVHEAFRRALADPQRPVAAVVDDTLAWAASEGRADTAASAAETALLAAQLARAVRLLRHREARGGGALAPDPAALELDFGEGEGLVLAPGLALRGRIDRVDRGRGAAAVVDYKLSETSAKKAYQAFGEGLDVQLPLYALAVERLFGDGVVGLTWMAALSSARYGCWSEDALDLAGGAAEAGRVDGVEDLASVKRAALDACRALLDELRAGRHPRQADDPKRCGLCGWRTICRPAYRLEDAELDADPGLEGGL